MEKTVVVLSDEVCEELASDPVTHLSTQIAAGPGYVAEVFQRLAGETEEGETMISVIRGYN